MEDQIFEQNPGVEEAPAAEVQIEEPSVSEVNEQPESDTGVEESEVAAQSTEKDFASALKAREEQIRSKLEQEYGTKAKEAERYQQMLDRTAKFYGFDNHDDYMAALEQAELDKQIQQEAEKLGVDEEVIRNHLQPLNQKVSEYEKQLNELKMADELRKVEAKIQSMEKDSENYPDFGKYKNDVINIAAEKGYSLEDAYIIASYKDRVALAAREAQQQAVRSLQQNAESSTGSLGDDAPELASGYAGMSASERKAFRERVKAGQI